MNVSSATTVPEAAAAAFGRRFQKLDDCGGLTVFCEQGTLNHGGHGSLKPEPGLLLTLIQQDLLNVDVEDVEVEEGAVHKALKQTLRPSTGAGLLHGHVPTPTLRLTFWTLPSASKGTPIWKTESRFCTV